MDCANRQEFVAYDLTEDQIRSVLGADGLVYQTLEDLLSVGRELNPGIRQFESSCFSGAPNLGPDPVEFAVLNALK